MLQIWQQHAFLASAVVRRNMQHALQAAFLLII
jgi:hypothetical protein